MYAKPGGGCIAEGSLYMTPLTVCCVSACGCFFSSLVSGRKQRPIIGQLLPLKMTYPLWLTLHLLSWNDMSQPALQSPTTDNRLWSDKLGRIYPYLAAGGNCRRSSSHSCVDDTFVPFGIVTITGDTAGISLGLLPLYNDW